MILGSPKNDLTWFNRTSNSTHQLKIKVGSSSNAMWDYIRKEETLRSFVMFKLDIYAPRGASADVKWPQILRMSLLHLSKDNIAGQGHYLYFVLGNSIRKGEKLIEDTLWWLGNKLTPVTCKAIALSFVITRPLLGEEGSWGGTPTHDH